MTSSTTKEQAVEVLRVLTAEHGQAPYFMNAEIVYTDGFFGVDIKVDGVKWRARDQEQVCYVPAQIDRVPVCVMVHG